MKTKLMFAMAVAALWLAAGTAQAQLGIFGTNGVLAEVEGWAGSYNTNNLYGNILIWDGVVLQDQIAVGNELGASWDIYRTAPANSPSGFAYFAAEERFRQAGIAGSLLSEAGGAEVGWTKYDFRAYGFMDGVHRENAAATSTSGGHVAMEVGVGFDKMMGAAGGLNTFISWQTGDHSKAPFIGASMEFGFGNGTGFLGLGPSLVPATTAQKGGKAFALLGPAADPVYR